MSQGVEVAVSRTGSFRVTTKALWQPYTSSELEELPKGSKTQAWNHLPPKVPELSFCSHPAGSQYGCWERASALPGNLLETHILRHHPGSTESESLLVGSSNLCLSKPSGDCSAGSSSRTTAPVKNIIVCLAPSTSGSPRGTGGWEFQIHLHGSEDEPCRHLVL